MGHAYDELSELLAQRVPALRGRYAKEIEWWGDDRPGPHVIYGDLLNPRITELLKAPAENAEELRTIFVLLEDLAQSVDDMIVDLLGATVCKHLLAEDSLYAAAVPFMGSGTRQICEEMQAWKPSQRG